MRDSDLPGAADALVEVYRTDGYPVEGVADPIAWLKSDAVLASWVAEVDGAVVGHVAVMQGHGEAAVSLWVEQSGTGEANVAVLGRLFVVRAARSHSTGRRLMEAAMQFGRCEGVRLVLDVMTKDVAAIRLYKRLGWRKIGETVHQYGADQSTAAECYVSPEA
jgi:GNAT superfamily N-acetyltransferase